MGRKSDAHYLADQQAFSAHFHPGALAKTGAKTILLCGVAVSVQYIEEQLALEDDDEDVVGARSLPSPKKPVGDPYRDVALRCSVMFFKSISVTTTTRTLEYLSVQLFDARTAGKFMKCKLPLWTTVGRQAGKPVESSPCCQYVIKMLTR